MYSIRETIVSVFIMSGRQAGLAYLIASKLQLVLDYLIFSISGYIIMETVDLVSLLVTAIVISGKQ